MNDPTIFFPVTLTELKNFLLECTTEIAVAVSNNKIAEVDKSEKYLTRNEAAEFLRIGLQTLNSGTKSGKFTGYRIGARVLYKQSELEAALVPTNRYTVPGAKRGPKPKAARA